MSRSVSDSTMSRLLDYLTPSSFRRRTNPEDHDPSVSEDDGEDGVPALAQPSREPLEPRSESLAAELFPPKGQEDPVNNKDVLFDEDAGDEPARMPQTERGPLEEELDQKHSGGDSISSSLVNRLLDMLQTEITKNSAHVTRKSQSEQENEDGEYCKLRGRLPKIEYSKLVVLSLTNFAEYKEAIKVC